MLLSFSNSLIAFVISSGFSGGTNNPVILLDINSGIPPTFVAITGTCRKNASLMTEEYFQFGKEQLEFEILVQFSSHLSNLD